MRIASKPFTLPPSLIRQIKFMSPNIYELNAIAEQMNYGRLIENANWSIEQIFCFSPNSLQIIKDSTRELLELVDNVILTLGPRGILLMRKDYNNTLPGVKRSYNCKSNTDSRDTKYKLYGIEKISGIVNLSGAGDGFNVGFITALINGFPEDICVSVGLECAKSAMRSSTAVPNVYIEKNHTCWESYAAFTLI